MDNKNIRVKGAWDLGKTEDYLFNTRYPLRLATLGVEGVPLVTSVWYLYDNGVIWCAVQNDSDIARNIRSDSKCGFEVGPNKPPYMGVRGKGEAKLVPERGGEKLEKLIGMFLDEKNSELADWLLKRKETEVAILIQPDLLFSWDYSGRMK